MSNTLIKVWGVLLLLPIVPVIILYAFFAGQNYFELKDTAKGIVAVGPIAAYVGIVIIGWTIYRKLSPSVNPIIYDLLGNWTFVSTTSHGTKGKGNCYIQNDKGELTISGDLIREDGKETGNWHCEMAQVKENRLFMAYSLTTVSESGIESLDGITILSFGASPVKTMNGIWIITGKDKQTGTIVYNRST